MQPVFSLRLPRPPSPTLFPYTTLFRSLDRIADAGIDYFTEGDEGFYRDSSRSAPYNLFTDMSKTVTLAEGDELRSEEHTSELQSRFDLVCRLLLEKKNNA